MGLLCRGCARLAFRGSVANSTIQLRSSTAELVSWHHCKSGGVNMCKLCDAGFRQNHFGSRRNFLKGAAATGAVAAGLNLFRPRPAAADDAPFGSGVPGRRYVIRGGSVMSMDPKVGDFPQADVLVEGKKFLPSDRICMSAVPERLMRAAVL